MAGNPTLNAIKVTTVGVRIAATAASQDTALPVGSTGAAVKLYRFVTLANAVHVKVGPAGGTATGNDLTVTSTGIILDCGGCTNFQIIEDASATAGILQVSPVEGG